MHGPPVSFEAILGGLLAGQVLVLFAVLQTYLLKARRMRGPSKMVLDGLSLLMGAGGVAVVTLFAAVALAFTVGAARAHAVFAFLAVTTTVLAFLAKVAADRGSGHVPAAGLLVAAMAAMLSAVFYVVSFVTAAAAWWGLA